MWIHSLVTFRRVFFYSELSNGYFYCTSLVDSTILTWIFCVAGVHGQSKLCLTTLRPIVCHYENNVTISLCNGFINRFYNLFWLQLLALSSGAHGQAADPPRAAPCRLVNETINNDLEVPRLQSFVWPSYFPSVSGVVALSFPRCRYRWHNIRDRVFPLIVV